MITFATMVNDAYVEGFICLYKSIVLNGEIGHPGFVVLCNEVSDLKKDLMSALPNVTVIDTFDDDSAVPEGLSDWQKACMKKLQVFKLTEYEKVIFVDADMLCLGSLASLVRTPAFAMVPNVGESLYPDINGRLTFNTGLMVIEPDNNMYEGMVNLASSMKGGTFSDQEIINRYMHFNDLVPRSLHIKYNAIISNKVGNSKLYSNLERSGIALLHFTAYKPWFGKEILKGRSIFASMYMRAHHMRKKLRYKNEHAVWTSIMNTDI